MKFGRNITTDGLIFCIDYANKRSYIGSGTEANNLVGIHTATLYNTVSPFDSANGGFMTFDGSNDYGKTTFDTFANPPFTIEVWFKSGTGSLKDGIFSNRLGSSNSFRQVSLFIAGDSNISTSGTKFGCYHKGSSGTRTNCIGTSNVCDGNWHQGVVVSTTGNSYNYIYVDGVLEDESDAATINMTENPVYTIGGLGDSTIYTFPFNGSISNIKYYNKVLSATEISQNYNALKHRFI
tara:strand:+ start:301 stop:1011 length:711 start_codon:yes stop_codon:yes gene_type:complete